MSEAKAPIIIKKYANRRLYNTDSSSYVTLDFLSQLVRDNVEFVVLDAKTGEDITRQVLTQIIFEEENSGSNLLSVDFLRNLISYYGKSVSEFFPSYLEMSVKSFNESQEHWKKFFADAKSGQPMDVISNAVKTNLEIFNQATKAISTMAPFQNFVPKKEDGTKEDAGETSDIAKMREQLKAMQEKLDKMG